MLIRGRPRFARLPGRTTMCRVGAVTTASPALQANSANRSPRQAAGHGNKSHATSLYTPSIALPLRLAMLTPCSQSYRLCSPSGGFCSASGAASVRQTYEACRAGTYNELNGSSSNASCVACAPGKANPVPGSSTKANCLDCLPGSVAAGSGETTCELCAAGRFQSLGGRIACGACKPGSYCPLGASAPLPW